MKIAYIFAYFGDGGAEAHALTLAKKARESGNEAVFIIDKLTATAQKRLEENLMVMMILSIIKTGILN